MSHKQLSPKQYITTNARTLPLFKCLVNADWRTAGMANVIVMRQHVNGNVTMGGYLVDLRCLGVKDVVYFFNITEEHALEISRVDDLAEIDYDLAHNIVYAGHDFAMNFHIKPHKDFSIAKYILEDDNEEIPIIKIETGDKEGLPFLLVHQSGQYAEALANLKKYAGEGNYKYLIASEEFVEDYYEDDDEVKFSIHDFDENEIDAMSARDIDFDVESEVQIEDRNIIEKMILLIELYARGVRIENEDFFLKNNPIFKNAFDILDNSDEIISGSTSQQETEWGEKIEEQSGYPNLSERIIEDKKKLEKNAENPFVFFNIFSEYFPLKNIEEYVDVLFSDLLIILEKQSAKYPLAELLLRFNKISEVVNDIINIDNAKINTSSLQLKTFDSYYKHLKITDAYPNKTDLGFLDLHVFALIQSILHALKKDEKMAIGYYDLAVEAFGTSTLLVVVQSILLAKFVN